MNAVIVSIGTELVTGQQLDTNTAWIAAELSRVGVNVAYHATVGDDVARIAETFKNALGEAQLVVVTGGLGPTLDDLTREALANAIDSPLEENPGALAQLQAFFERWQRPMPESNKVQAMIPRGCTAVENPRGTAPGIHYKHGDRHLFALPGVPGEMKAMFTAAVLPIAQSDGGAAVREGRLLCFGVSEADVGEKLADLMARDRNPLVGTTACDAVISVRVSARGRGAAAAEALLDADLAECRRRLGRAVFGEGDTTLAEAVAEILNGKNLTIATAESCTGGLLAKRLTDVPGSSAYFRQGYVTYANQAKTEILGIPAAMIEKEGAVSEPVARAMASACRSASGADVAVAITGIAGPSGGSLPDKPIGLVYLGLAKGEGIEVKRLLLGEHLTRSEIRGRTASAALNLLRLRLS